MDERILGATVRELIGEILARYGSIDAFCHHLRGLLDAPTVQLPVVVLPLPPVGRHRMGHARG